MMDSNRQPNLSSLPSEIKDSIYKHAVGDACLHIDITPRPKTTAERKAVPSSGWCGTTSMRQKQELEVGQFKVYTPTTLVALLLTCRATNHEVQPLYVAAIEKLVIRCAGIGDYSRYRWIGGFGSGGGGVTFDKVSKAMFAPSQKSTPALKRFWTFRKPSCEPGALLTLIQNVKTVEVVHWDPYPAPQYSQDPKQRARAAVSIIGNGDAFWEWISLNHNIQSVVVHSKMMEWDEEERTKVCKSSIEVAWNLEADRLVSQKLDGPMHNVDTRWQIVSDSIGIDGSNEE